MDHLRSRRDGDLDDRFLGLYLSDTRVDELLADGPPRAVAPSRDAAARLTQVEEDAEAAAAAGTPTRLTRLARAFGLAPLDIELLLIALAPDIDPRFEALYGYLNDDVAMRRPTVGLALRLCGVPLTVADGRARFGGDAPLRRGGLVRIADVERPLLTRGLRIPDRVVGHLLGETAPDPLVADITVELVPVPSGTSEQLTRALEEGATTLYVRDEHGVGGAAAAAAAIDALGGGVLAIDLERVGSHADLGEVALAATREARLLGAGLVAGPVETIADAGPAAVRAFAEAGGVVVLVGRDPWDPTWAREIPVLVDAERIDREGQAAAWEVIPAGELDDGVDPVEATAMFRLTPEQIIRAGRSARLQAIAAGGRITGEDLRRGARAQNAAGLQRLARRLEPEATWEDLLLPPAVEAQLRELPMRWRHRDRVLEDWGMGRGAAGGRGVSALFAGPSGTGKTLSAEVIASDLGLDLYAVDLSTVVDKYIGETSKNLERIFAEADRVNGVLLFDEADALFGKRSSVSDAKDRHANVEVAFLLQRMESFDGVAILTTNLAANLDEAFLRRLDAIVDFPTPDEPQRLALWEAKIAGVPCADDLDLGQLAAAFKLTGSEIRSIVVSAAYHAAAGDRPVGMEDLMRAVVREHRKLGKHLSPSDMGDHAHLLDAPV